MNVNGININHYDRGTGEAVLFLHGWGSNFDSFISFLDSLTGYYRVCALDLPGFGKSQEPPTAWSVGDYADFVLGYIRQLGLERVILIGHSFGGRVIIKMAGRKDPPLDFPKIILVDSAGIRPEKTAKQKIRQSVYKLVRNIISIDFIEKRWPELLESWRRKNASADYLNASPLMRQCLVKTVNEDLRRHLPLISSPTLLIWGENDTATPVEDARVMEKMIPEAGLVVLKNAGHYSFLDQGYTFGRVLDSFLDIKRT
ncbi:alpha/beta hydrolase [Deltaproteobacteria bacterium Smac51]|nr:alpha/beta hydrolase [Deltaproteobacteria bacterium Smac51]